MPQNELEQANRKLMNFLLPRLRTRLRKRMKKSFQ